MYCCVECFSEDHPHLIWFVKNNGKKGDCDYCDTTDTTVIEPSELRDLFEPLLTLYEPVSPGENTFPWEQAIDKGDYLANLIDYEWFVFSDLVSDKNVLLEDIFTEGLTPDEIRGLPYSFDADEFWMDRDDSVVERLPAKQEWDAFKRHIRESRRFIPDFECLDLRDPQEWMPAALSRLSVDTVAGEDYFRCRRGGNRKIEEVGAPPREGATAGRANPLGIVFLYLSTDRDTAIAEMRPWKGQELSVATFRLREQVRLVDLTEAQKLKSPFGAFSDLDSLRSMREDFGILAELSADLSTPVDPDRSGLDYLPTQYITEVIRSMDYDGLLFRSAVGTGKNLVLFDAGIAEGIDVKTVKVESISYKWS